MLKQALHLSKSRPQIHELGIKFVHVSHRRRLPSVTGPGMISQFADLLLLPRRHRLLGARHVARQRVADCGALGREKALQSSQLIPSLGGTVKNSFPSRLTRLVGLVNSSSWQRVGCLVALLPQRWGWMVPTSAYAKIWQIFGKMVFWQIPL